MSEEMNEEVQPEPEEEIESVETAIDEEAASPEDEAVPASGRRKFLVGGGVALIVAVCCCLVVAGILFFVDPFKWYLAERLNGTYDAAAANLPADTPIYVAVDLLGLADPNAERVFQVFQQMDSPAQTEPLTFAEQLDESLTREYELTFSEDVLPWVNRYAGIAILDFEISQFGEPEPSEVLFLMSVANRTAAEAFVEKLIMGVEANVGQQFTVETYGRTDIYVMDSDFDSEDIAFALTRGMFILTNNADAVKKVLDAPDGSTLMESPTYLGAKAALPNDPVASVFFSWSFYQELLEGVAQGNPLASNPIVTGQLEGAHVMAGLSFSEVGLVLDVVVAANEELTTQLEENYKLLTSDEFDVINRFPAETYLYMQSYTPVGQMEEQFAQMGDNSEFQDIEDSLALLEAQLGFNAFEDLLFNLSDELALGLVAAQDGTIVEMQGVDMGFVFISGVSDTEKTQKVIDGANAYVQEQFFLPPTAKDINGEEIFVVGDPFGSTELFAYGLVEQNLVMGTSATVVEDLFNGGDSLAQNARYDALWANFPEGAVPVLYADIAALVQLFSSQMSPSELDNFAPFTRLGAATLAPEDGFAKSTIILIIESP
jgi:hypothetical protein